MTEDPGNIQLTVTLREWTAMVMAVEMKIDHHIARTKRGDNIMNRWHRERADELMLLGEKLCKQHAEGDS
jgi:hypothetical protein